MEFYYDRSVGLGLSIFHYTHDLYGLFYCFPSLEYIT